MRWRDYRLAVALGTPVGVAGCTVAADRIARAIGLRSVPDGFLSMVLVTLVPLATIVVGHGLRRPRSDPVGTAAVATTRALFAGVVLAAVGYYDYTFRVPRPMLAVTTVFYAVVLGVWAGFAHRRFVSRPVDL